MVSNFALLLSHDGIRLAHRTSDGWREVGCVDLSSADMAQDLEILRKKGEALNGGVFSTKIVLPDDQIKYLSLPAPATDEDRAEAIRDALERATPYLIDELAYDWEEGEETLNVAAAARDTLVEAEQFAVQFGFNPLGFVASPADKDFSVEPFFGATKAAAHILDDDAEFEAELNKVVLIPADVEVSAEETGAAELKQDKAPEDSEPVSEEAPEATDDGFEDDLAKELAEIEAMIAAEDPQETADPGAAELMDAAEEAKDAPAADPSEEAADETAPADESDPGQVDDQSDEQDDEGPGFSALLRADRKSPSDDTPAKRIGPAAAPTEGFVAGRRALDDPDLLNKDLPNWAPPVSAEKPLSFDEDLDTSRLDWLKAEGNAQDDTEADAPPTWMGDTSAEKDDEPDTDTPASWVPPKDAPLGATVYDRIADEEEKEAAPDPKKPAFGLNFPDPGEDKNKTPLVIAALILVLLLLGGGLFAARSWFFASPPPQVAVPVDAQDADQEVIEDIAAPEGDPDQPEAVVETDTTESPVEDVPEAVEALDSESLPALDTVDPDPALLTEPLGDVVAEDEAAADQDFDTELAFEPESEAVEDLPEDDVSAASDLEVAYVATGIWPVAPDAPDSPSGTTIGDLYITGLDPELRVSDAVAITPEAQMLSDAALDTVPNPPAFGTSFNRDERGLVRATPEGAVTPDGALVFSGTPPVVPPLAPGRPDPTSEAEAARSALADKQPQLRPAEEVEPTPANPALKGKIPRLRPASIAEQAEVMEIIADNPLALTSTKTPRLRPANMAAIVTAAERASIAAQTTRPSAPTSASVSGAATQQDAIPLRDINLIGVFGTRNDRRALIRLANGRYVKVEVGSRVDGGTVTAIDATKLYYNKNGKSYVLEIPGS